MPTETPTERLWRREAQDWEAIAGAYWLRIERLEAENGGLRAALEDVTQHANPIAEDDDGHVAVGYTVTTGAIHRAIAALQGAIKSDAHEET